MPLTPGYGETPLPEDEVVALLPHVVEVLDKPINRADVYDLEQAVQAQVFETCSLLCSPAHCSSTT